MHSYQIYNTPESTANRSCVLLMTAINSAFTENNHGRSTKSGSGSFLPVMILSQVPDHMELTEHNGLVLTELYWRFFYCKPIVSIIKQVFQSWQMSNEVKLVYSSHRILSVEYFCAKVTLIASFGFTFVIIGGGLKDRLDLSVFF